MKRKYKQSIEWLEFDLLQEFPQLRHGVFLRGKGFDLNGKDNHQQVLDLMGLEKGVKLKQCHQADVIEAKGAQKGWTLHENYDGVMTQEKGVGLMVRHADCQATIFYDPIHEAIANVHSGWRGSVSNIYLETVLKMQQAYGSNPAELRVCISPSLGPDAAEFKYYRKELPEHFWTFQKKPNYFNFWEISRMQLMEAGVKDEHIEIAGICTYANEQDFYSYRRSGMKENNGTLVALECRSHYNGKDGN